MARSEIFWRRTTSGQAHESSKDGRSNCCSNWCICENSFKTESSRRHRELFWREWTKLRVQRPSQVPKGMHTVVRKVIRDLFLEKKTTPTLDTIFERLCVLTVHDVHDLNFFNESDIPCMTSKVWLWSRTTLYRFMESIGFVYGDRVSHYEHTKNREDIACMRDDYSDWISYYRSNDYTIYYQDETWVFKNMTSSEIRPRTYSMFRLEREIDRYSVTLDVEKEAY